MKMGAGDQTAPICFLGRKTSAFIALQAFPDFRPSPIGVNFRRSNIFYPNLSEGVCVYADTQVFSATNTPVCCE
jgi:hypothetical protein